MELDPILAMEDSGLLPVVAAPQAAAPENNAANKDINNNPIAGAVSSSSLPLDEDPVTSLLGSGSTAAAVATAQEKPSAAVPPSTPTRSPLSVEANTSNNNEDVGTGGGPAAVVAEDSCASCGIAGDGIALNKCTACNLVRYCCVKCQMDHRQQHKETCKKREAELRDEILFRQPESNHRGDCPICCLPLSINPLMSTLYSCCCKIICKGCALSNRNRQIDGRLERVCPFCRIIIPTNLEDAKILLMKRIEVNDPVAIGQMALIYEQQGDRNVACEYRKKAAELGNISAHYELAGMYRLGHGVEVNKKKEVHHLEEAAIGGQPVARHRLGNHEYEHGRFGRAAKHYIIAAKLGFDKSIDVVKHLYQCGHVSKEDFAEALRGHQAAVNATKSPQREEAAKHSQQIISAGSFMSFN